MYLIVFLLPNVANYIFDEIKTMVKLVAEGSIDEKNQNRILHYNLQWFAKDGEGGEKTEPATAKKLKCQR